jgi:hypothetical protein
VSAFTLPTYVAEGEARRLLADFAKRLPPNHTGNDTAAILLAALAMLFHSAPPIGRAALSQMVAILLKGFEEHRQ